MEITLLNGGELRTERTELDVKNNSGNLTYVLPMVGPETYQTIMAKISKQGLMRPTTAQIFSFVNLALQNRDEQHCKDLLAKFKVNYFWSATENLWTPEGVIVYDNIDGKMPSDRKTLMQMAKDKDSRARFVEYGFVTGSQDVSTLVKNPYLIAQVGGDKDFAEDIVAKVAQGISRNGPYVWALNKPSQDVKKYTALDSGWYVDRLCVSGNYVGGGYGFVSGVKI